MMVKKLGWGGLAGGFFLLSLSLLALFAPTVKAAWVAGSYGGSWVTKSDSSWESANNMASGWFEYEYADFNMTMSYDCLLVADVLTVEYNWWEVWNTRTIREWINITLTNGGNFVAVSYRKQLAMSGGWAGLSFDVDVRDNSGVTDCGEIFDIGLRDLDVSIEGVRVYFFHQGSTLNVTVLSVGVCGSVQNYYRSKSVTKNMGSAWFGDLDIELYVKKDVENAVTGHVEGHKLSENFNVHDEVVENPISELGWLERLFAVITRPVYEMLPDWLRDFVDYTVGLFSPLYELLLNLWAVALGVIPLLPYVFIVWIVDAAVTSVDKGSLEPIGVVFSKIVEVVQGAGKWLVSIAHAFYDVITFWN